jgi:ferredoxin/nitrate reductase gamma subunit
MAKVDTKFLKEIKKYGAFDISACFNCGNCTAVCPLSKEDTPFPRKLIRYAHLGLKDKILNKKEMWLCYYCGECSDTCPRQAEPGAFMAALRRYNIAKNDLTGISAFLYKSGGFNFIFMTIIALFFAFFMYAHRLESRAQGKIIEIFHIPFELVHNIGIIIMSIAGLILTAGMLVMFFRTTRVKEYLNLIKNGKSLALLWQAIKEAFNIAINEMLAFKRFQDCDSETPEKKERLFLVKPWFLHATVAWGFMMLFSATVLDYLFKDPELKVSLLYPARLIGTIGGILLMYGTTLIIIKRLKADEKPYTNTMFSDWWFLFMLWFIGLSGFILEILVYLPFVNQKLADILFLVHVAPAMELVVMAAFTKLAHVFYRPIALFLDGLNIKISKLKTEKGDEKNG